MTFSNLPHALSTVVEVLLTDEILLALGFHLLFDATLDCGQVAGDPALQQIAFGLLDSLELGGRRQLYVWIKSPSLKKT